MDEIDEIVEALFGKKQFLFGCEDYVLELSRTRLWLVVEAVSGESIYSTFTSELVLKRAREIKRDFKGLEKIALFAIFIY